MDENNFYSIDRLVEFGLGLVVAQQMVRTMNDSIQNMAVPGSFTMQQPNSPALFYAVVNGGQVGPLSEREVAGLILQKRIVNETYMWKPGMPSWALAGKIPDVVRLAALTPPPPPPVSTKP
jgi:hypothetical protein